MGATYVAVAAEHALAHPGCPQRQHPAEAFYRRSAERGGVAEPTIATQEKEGNAPTSLFVTPPLTGEKLPVWVAQLCTDELMAKAR